MYNCEYTLATDPSAGLVLDLTVIKYRGFVQLDASPVYGSGEWNFVRVEIFPTRLSYHFLGRIAQNVLD